MVWEMGTLHAPWVLGSCSLPSPVPWQCPCRDHARPALGVAGAVGLQWRLHWHLQTLQQAGGHPQAELCWMQMVLSSGSPVVSCPRAVRFGLGGVRRAQQWDELWDRLAVAGGSIRC